MTGEDKGKRDRRVRLSRDSILFVTGLLGIAHETLISHVDRPTLLILFAAMSGLPAFLHGDEVSFTRAPKRKIEPPDDRPAYDDSEVDS